MTPRPRPAGVIEHLGFPYVHTSVHASVSPETRLRFLCQDRISRPIDGMKLIFHMRIYLYETSRNIQEH